MLLRGLRNGGEKLTQIMAAVRRGRRVVPALLAVGMCESGIRSAKVAARSNGGRR